MFFFEKYNLQKEKKVSKFSKLPEAKKQKNREIYLNYFLKF